MSHLLAFGIVFEAYEMRATTYCFSMHLFRFLIQPFCWQDMEVGRPI